MRIHSHFGAYKLLAWHIEQDVSPGRVLFVQSKQAPNLAISH
jgi:hypothetical protein